jgi:hypothetical protein
MSLQTLGADFRGATVPPATAMGVGYLAALRADASALCVGSRALRVRAIDIRAQSREVRAVAARRYEDCSARAASAVADVNSRP